MQVKEEEFGQRDLDSDEMNEEMMDEYTPTNLIQPGWKISDDASPTPSTTTDQTNEDKQRAGWGARESVALGAQMAQKQYNQQEEQKHNPSPGQNNISDGAIESDGAYESDNQGQADEDTPADGSDEKNNSLSMEETKTYEEFKSKVTDQPFYGSDAEAYSDDEGDGDDG